MWQPAIEPGRLAEKSVGQDGDEEGEGMQDFVRHKSAILRIGAAPSSAGASPFPIRAT
jgi:hypothetical protein